MARETAAQKKAREQEEAAAAAAASQAGAGDGSGDTNQGDQSGGGDVQSAAPQQAGAPDQGQGGADTADASQGGSGTGGDRSNPQPGADEDGFGGDAPEPANDGEQGPSDEEREAAQRLAATPGNSPTPEQFEAAPHGGQPYSTGGVDPAEVVADDERDEIRSAVIGGDDALGESDKIDEALYTDLEDGTVVLKRDVSEKFYFPDTKRPSYKLIFTKGQRVSKSEIDAMNARVDGDNGMVVDPTTRAYQLGQGDSNADAVVEA